MVLYFAYGSNMLEKQMLERGCSLINKNIGKLYNFEFKFNKKGNNGSGKANIIEKERSVVEGVIFEIDEVSLQRLTLIEVGYHKKIVPVLSKNRVLNCVTFVADEDKIDNTLKPKKDYKEKIVLGAKEFGLTQESISFLESFEVL